MVLYGVGAVVALWFSSTIVGAVNSVPLVSILCPPPPRRLPRMHLWAPGVPAYMLLVSSSYCPIALGVVKASSNTIYSMLFSDAVACCSLMQLELLRSIRQS